ncbi:hypothetical protein KIW84_071279 [Lathyrus oleraceus]|uniref:Uncharacterized protein n=1 Tax=Pisum sativum TaxID=3888 RepID=A0A9D4VID6_PEA|nr:hypothetical protein KIW84_071279 [Pisum sativum]
MSLNHTDSNSKHEVLGFVKMTSEQVKFCLSPPCLFNVLSWSTECFVDVIPNVCNRFLGQVRVIRKLTFEKTYSNIVFPTNGPQLWLIVDHVPIFPPVMRMEIGHPKKLRNKANDEPKNPHVLSRILTIVTCKKCEEMGYNKRSCKGKRAANRAISKGGNKAKKEKNTKGEKKAKKTIEKQPEIG